jgi:peptidoglycan/LPS O-acetylase OafA/YrhL
VFVLIAIVMLLAPFFDLGQLSRLRADALASMGYVTNWALIFAHQSYFESFARPSLFRHLWSLAVEEQFYLLWPVVFAFCITRFGHKRLLVGALVGALASTALMWILFNPRNPNRDFYGTDTRAAPLLIGVALAFIWNPERLRAKTGQLAPIALDALGALGLSMVLITFLTVHDYEVSLYHGGFLLLAIWTACLVAALAHPAAQIGRVVGNPALRWLGLRSYSFYLWHWPVLELTRPGIDVSLHGPVLFLLQLAATIALADLSYRFVEQPFRRSRSWQRPEWLRIGRVGIAGGALAVVLIVGWSGIVSNGQSGESGVASAQIRPSAKLRERLTKTRPARIPRGRWVPVLAVGDSVMVDSRACLSLGLGPLLTLNAQVGRQPADLISLLHRYRAAGKLPDEVVVQMGNNGPVYHDDLVRLRAVLQGVPHVYLVNVDVPRSWQGEVNSALSEAARDWSAAQLVDWHDVAASHGDVTTDGVHLTTRGTALYCGVIAASVRRISATAGSS